MPQFARTTGCECSTDLSATGRSVMGFLGSSDGKSGVESQPSLPPTWPPESLRMGWLAYYWTGRKKKLHRAEANSRAREAINERLVEALLSATCNLRATIAIACRWVKYCQNESHKRRHFLRRQSFTIGITRNRPMSAPSTAKSRKFGCFSSASIPPETMPVAITQFLGQADRCSACMNPVLPWLQVEMLLESTCSRIS